MTWKISNLELKRKERNTKLRKNDSKKIQDNSKISLFSMHFLLVQKRYKSKE